MVPLQLGGESVWCFSLPSARRWGMVQGSLRDRLPGESLFETLRAQMPVADRRGPLGRLFGVHPVPSELRSWYVGAVGELAVARALANLPDGWVVLHSVPVGERGSDIDHVLLAPTCRVITVNTKHHEGATVWVASKAMLVNGRKQPYLRNSRHEAERAARNLSAAIGSPADVLAMIVVVGAKKLTIREEPDGIAVVRLKRVRSFLARRVKPPRVPVDVAAVRDAVLRPQTWSKTALPHRDGTLDAWSNSLRQSVDVARWRRTGWSGGGLVAIAVALLSSGALETAMHLP
jgi:hypothetical protein